MQTVRPGYGGGESREDSRDPSCVARRTLVRGRGRGRSRHGMVRVGVGVRSRVRVRGEVR